MMLCLITVPLPCIVSEWTAWSAPDATGTRFRYRMMLRPALNGGKECPDLLEVGKGMFLHSINLISFDSFTIVYHVISENIFIRI